MNRMLFTLVALSLFGCGSDDAVTYADFQYQAQCTIMGMCSAPPVRSIDNLDGEDDFDIQCTATENAMGNLSVSFSAEKIVAGEAAWGVSVRSLQIPAAGGSPLGQSTFTIQEDDFRYQGLAGANTPSAAQPCQIRNIRFEEETGGTAMKGEFLCIQFSAAQDQSKKREVTFPNARSNACDAADETTAFTACADLQPAEFRILNCAGI